MFINRIQVFKLHEQHNKREQGFTLIEILAAFLILGLLFMGLVGFSKSNMDIYRKNKTVGEKTQDISFALMTISRVIRGINPASNVKVSADGKMLMIDGSSTNDKYKIFTGSINELRVKNSDGSYDTLVEGIDKSSEFQLNGKLLTIKLAIPDGESTFIMVDRVRLRN